MVFSFPREKYKGFYEEKGIMSMFGIIHFLFIFSHCVTLLPYGEAHLCWRVNFRQD